MKPLTFPRPKRGCPVALPVARDDATGGLFAIAAALNAVAAAIRQAGLHPVASRPLSLSTPAGASTPGGGLVPTVSELVNEFLKAKARAGASDRYLRQLRVTLRAFAMGRGRRPVDSITCAELEKFILNPDWQAKTRKGYLGDIRNLFGFAVRRDYLAKSPAVGVELGTMGAGGSASPVVVHSPGQVSKVLEYARAADLGVMRLLALRYFGGLRSAEALRLRESDIRPDTGFVEVPAAKSKTRSRRLVTITPALAAWLALGGELRAVGEMTVRRIVRGSKVDWAHNVTRHSFVSYHLAHFGSAAKTALEAGHSEAMLFRHYRAVVSPAVAAEFWAVRPQGAAVDGHSDGKIGNGESLRQEKTD